MYRLSIRRPARPVLVLRHQVSQHRQRVIRADLALLADEKPSAIASICIFRGMPDNSHTERIAVNNIAVASVTKAYDRNPFFYVHGWQPGQNSSESRVIHPAGSLGWS